MILYDELGYRKMSCRQIGI